MDKNSVKKWLFVSHGKRVSLRVFGHLRHSTAWGGTIEFALCVVEGKTKKGIIVVELCAPSALFEAYMFV
jgi:hypothetical protein